MSPTVLPTSTGVCATGSSCTRPLGFRLIPARSTCTASIVSPPSFESLAKNDRRRVHDHEEDQEHDDGARGFLDEPALGAVRPQIDLHRQYGGRIGNALGNIHDE